MNNFKKIKKMEQKLGEILVKQSDICRSDAITITKDELELIDDDTIIHRITYFYNGEEHELDFFEKKKHHKLNYNYLAGRIAKQIDL